MTGRCGKRGKMGKKWRRIQMKKILSILSVPGSVAEVGIALCYSLFSMLFLMFGYEDYLINRRWIVPAGCFCAIVVFHFLIGMTLGHVSRYFEGHPVLFGEMGCFFGIIYILGEESSWISRLCNQQRQKDFPQTSNISIPTSSNKRITNIVVFYSDNSFQSFAPTE